MEIGKGSEEDPTEGKCFGKDGDSRYCGNGFVYFQYIGREGTGDIFYSENVKIQEGG